MILKSEKKGKLFNFKRIQANGSEDHLVYDITLNKFYKNGKDITESTAKKFFTNLTIKDFIAGCDSEELKNFLTYIYKNENEDDSRITNIGTFLTRIDSYKTREKLAVLGIFPFIRISKHNHEEEISISDIPEATRKLLQYIADNIKYDKYRLTYDNKRLYEGIESKFFVSDFYRSIIESYRYVNNLTKSDVRGLFKMVNECILLYSSGAFGHLRNIKGIISLLLTGGTDNIFRYISGECGTTYIPNCRSLSDRLRLYKCYTDNKLKLIELIPYMHYCINIEGVAIDKFIGLYTDCIRMGKNINKYKPYPKHLQSIHDINMMYNNLLNKEYDDSIFEELLVKNKGKYEQHINVYSNKIEFKLPTKSKDIKDEAIALQHCVASYIDSYINQECIIVFMRNSTEPDKHYVTLEIIGNEIVQARGKFHRIVNTEELVFINRYAKTLNLKLNINMEV